MADVRSRIEKLLAMAQQDESPKERDRARELLAKVGQWPPITDRSPRAVPHESPNAAQNWRTDADKVIVTFGVRTQRRTDSGAVRVIYIAAGSFQMADHEARKRHLSPQEWRYVTGAEALRGVLPDDEVVWGPAFHQHSDARQILDVVHTLEMQGRLIGHEAEL